MGTVLGTPAKMAQNRAELTPMMSQYFELTDRYDDCLVLFQVGDFYEVFCEAAEEVSRLLDVTLTAREDSTGRYPMAGIPVDNAATYVDGLLDAGYRVAVADQIEDPEEADGVVDRAVTRVLTPGTLTEDELLDREANNYVACLAGAYALAVLDVSTGEFLATSADTPAAVRHEIDRYDPSEAIVAPEADADVLPEECMVTPVEESAFDLAACRERAGRYFGDAGTSLAGDDEVRAVGALLAYAEYARGGGEEGSLDYIDRLTRYDPTEYVLLDRVALESLEVFETRSVGERGTTLVDVLDETASALGSRKLKQWLRRPLLDRDAIADRHDAVEEFAGDVRTRERAHDLLRDVYDVERLITRVSRGRANARDLRSLKQTLDVVPDLRELLADVDCEKLRACHDALDELADVRELIGRAIRPDPPQEVTEGEVIREGYSADLDDLRDTERAGREWVSNLEDTERERTGIDSLKVGFNQVHGYYIEVTKPNLEKVPEEYTRRQTLKNAERYYTPDLKRREDEILRAESRADSLEYDLFREVREAVAEEADRVRRVAETLAELDVLVGLAEVAVTHDYARPDLRDRGAGVRVEGGRHPVVERTRDRFVPNDVHLDRERRVALVTGPNMSGKSTYMRQVALTAVLAQVGSFVPAESASVGLVDRVFTRVGASDDIAGGQSTFMREMVELTEILRHATSDSLVLLDEVGRGTATTDGLALAWAVTEHLHDEVGAFALFATHHHDLTAVADELEAVENFHFAATREDGTVAFDHELREGVAGASYGVEVAEMAGVPDAVVDRARRLLADDLCGASEDRGVDPATGAVDGGPDADAEAALARLRDADLATTTPMEALTLLHDLQERLVGRRQ